MSEPAGFGALVAQPRPPPQMLRGDIPTAQSTSSEIREFYQTCRSILNHLRDGKSGENHKPTLDSIKKVLDEVATFCNLLFEPSSHTPGQKIVLFSACNSLHEKGRNMDMQKSVVVWNLTAQCALRVPHVPHLRGARDVSQDAATTQLSAGHNTTECRGLWHGIPDEVAAEREPCIYSAGQPSALAKSVDIRRTLPHKLQQQRLRHALRHAPRTFKMHTSGHTSILTERGGRAADTT